MSRFDEVDEEEETDEEPAAPDTEDEPNSGSGTSSTTEDPTVSKSETSDTDDSGNETPQEPPYQQPPQHPIHVRDDYWNEYQDTVNFDVQSVLARNNDIRNAKLYEANTAMVRLAAANPKALTKLILDERGVDVDLSDVGE
jgi:hypothetical protein